LYTAGRIRLLDLEDALDDILVDSDSLRSFSAALLVAVGVSEEDAAIAADVLVTADLTGHESHGVARLEGQYVRPVQSGRIRADAKLTTLRETAATLVLDADNGLGQPATKYAMDLCIAKAREAGTCVAVVRHSNHYGIAGYYPMMAVAQDMLGVCCTTAGALVVPTGGRTMMLGTNPLAFAAPARRNRPFMLDMATSVVPIGKVEVKARRATPLPLGWAVDGLGKPDTDSVAMLERTYGDMTGGLVPLGGLEAGHKGYGLAAMVDILSGVLAGATVSLHIRESMAGGKGADVGHMIAAIDIGAFFDSIDEFKDAMDTYIDDLHAAPVAPGTERIRVAGEPEFDTRERYLRNGLPLHAGVAASLRELGEELKVPAFRLFA
jgi:LDH2 family malate/lactate/ureidoglycolate dehydrogenase